jgi:hypothetical protein
VLDKGLGMIAREARKPERLEAMVARTEDLVVTVVAILNLVHELDPAAVEQTPHGPQLPQGLGRRPRQRRPRRSRIHFLTPAALVRPALACPHPALGRDRQAPVAADQRRQDQLNLKNSAFFTDDALRQMF